MNIKFSLLLIESALLTHAHGGKVWEMILIFSTLLMHYTTNYWRSVELRVELVFSPSDTEGVGVGPTG